MDKYGKIEGLHRVDGLLQHELVVTEKIHGTNCRFSRRGQSLIVGSRNNLIHDGENYHPEFDSYGMYAWVSDNINWKMLPEHIVFYGEFLGQGVQKGIVYFDPPRKGFACFDIKNGDVYLPWPEMQAICRAAGIDTVPFLGSGIFTVDELTEIMEQDSAWAKGHGIPSLQEGIVIKTINDVHDQYGQRLIAKYKNAKFAEKANKGSKQKAPKEHSPEWIAGSAYCTYARVENSIDKLRQETNEPLDMKHIPRLLKIFQTDVELDADDIPDNTKEFFRGALSGVVGFFQKWLRES